MFRRFIQPALVGLTFLFGLFGLFGMEGAARAQSPWQQSFVPRIIGGYLDKHGGLLVAASGGEQSEEAAEILRQAIRASRASRVVMDNSSLGSLAALDDQAIVRRAAGLPIDEIAVVRVFPGADTESAVVTFYDKRGKVLAAVSAEAGVPVTPRAGRSTAGEGVSNEAAGAVARVLRTDNGSRATDSAQEEYDRSYLGFLGITLINQYGAVLNRFETPYEGKYQRPIDLPDFFKKVGRKDLAEQARERHSRRIGLIVGGGVALGVGLGVGLGMALASLGKGSTCLAYGYGVDDGCLNYSNDNGLLYAGIALMAVGTVGGPIMMVAGGRINASPVPAEELKQLADEYNQALRKRLGLASERSQIDLPREPSPSPTLSLVPSIGAQGGGLMLRGTF